MICTQELPAKFRAALRECDRWGVEVVFDPTGEMIECWSPFGTRVGITGDQRISFFPDDAFHELAPSALVHELGHVLRRDLLYGAYHEAQSVGLMNGRRRPTYVVAAPARHRQKE